MRELNLYCEQTMFSFLSIAVLDVNVY